MRIIVRLLLPIFVIFLLLDGPAVASEAESWGQVTGALLGMSAACGYGMSATWIRNIVQHRWALSAEESDFNNATAVFRDYSNRAFILQSTKKPMTCKDVIRMARDSEAKWGGGSSTGR